MSSSSLPPGWTNCSLAELGSWIGGGTPSKARQEFWSHGTVPWVSPKDMKTSTLTDAEDHITESAVQQSATNVVAPGSVLVVTRSGILKHTLPVAVTRVRVALNQDLRALQPFPFVSPDYVAHVLRGTEQEVLRLCSKQGTTVQSVDSEKLLRFTIPVPPLAEQRRIVEALETQFTRLDAAVTMLVRVRANLKRYRTAVLQAAVEGRLGRAGDSARGLPDGWRRERMPALAKIVSGNTPAGIAGFLAETGEIPWFRIGDMNEPGNEVHLHRSRTWLSRTAAAKLGLRVLPRGTIVFPKRGGAIRTNKKRMLTRDSTIDLNTMALMPEPGVGPWLWLWMQKLDLGTIADGSNVPQINHSDVVPLEVPLPPIGVRDELVACADAYLSDIDAARDQVVVGTARIIRLRQAMLRQAFQGRLVPQDPHDEPASILLDRIRAERAAAASIPNKKSARSRR